MIIFFSFQNFSDVCNVCFECNKAVQFSCSHFSQTEQLSLQRNKSLIFQWFENGPLEGFRYLVACCCKHQSTILVSLFFANSSICNSFQWEAYPSGINNIL